VCGVILFVLHFFTRNMCDDWNSIIEGLFLLHHFLVLQNFLPYSFVS
jgi:hypothetical protein